MKYYIKLIALTLILFAGTSYVQSATEAAPKIDKVLVEKKARTLKLLSKGTVVKTYKVSLGFEPVGAKEIEGDGKTPEGHYKIDWRNPNSRYHKSLHISYPDAQDKAHAKSLGKSPGGDVFIHGTGNVFTKVAQDFLPIDWTLGCIAVTNDEIEDIWQRVKNGTPIEIRP